MTIFTHECVCVCVIVQQYVCVLEGVEVDGPEAGEGNKCQQTGG